MKYLTLIRHSIPSINSTVDNNDKYRFLNEDGISLIKKISNEIKRLNLEEAVFISSNAVRAYQTAIEFLEELNKSIPLYIENSLYYKIESLSELIQELLIKYEKFNNIWIFGHNPSLSNIASTILRTSFFLSRCSLLYFTFETHTWQNISPFNLKDYLIIDSKKFR